MAPTSPRPALPERRNPRIAPDVCGSLENNIRRRRIGKLPGITEKIKGTEAPFSYMHLRVGLPDDLDGAELHATQKNGKRPKSYFLMRRCKDGYLSATGLFRASFPWATAKEDSVERDYFRSQGKKVAYETAGNIWVHPEFALSIAEDYGITLHVVALLSTEPIKSRPDEAEYPVPPKFEISSHYLQIANRGDTSPSNKPKPETTRRRNSQASLQSSPARQQNSTVLLTPQSKNAADVPGSAEKSRPNKSPSEIKKAAHPDAADEEKVEAEENGEKAEQEDASADEYNSEADSRSDGDDRSESGSDSDGSEDEQDNEDDEEEEEEDVLFVGKPASAEEIRRKIREAEEMTKRAREQDRNAKVKGLSHGSLASKRQASEDPEDAPASHNAGKDSETSYNPFKRFRIINTIDPDETPEAATRRLNVKKRALFGLAATFIVGVALPYIS